MLDWQACIVLQGKAICLFLSLLAFKILKSLSGIILLKKQYERSR